MRHRFAPTVTLTVAIAALAGCSFAFGGGDDPEPTRTGAVAATPAPTWEKLYERVNSGVGRISVTTCDGGSTGSGFLVAGDLMLTAAHVVTDASSVSVRLGRQVRAADVVGSDEQSDLALIRLDRASEGHVFPLGEKAGVGADVAAIGYPQGQPIAMTRGAVTSVDRRVEVEGSDRRGLLQTDVAINPGNSGGPLLRLDGTVVGVVSAGSDRPGDGYAVQQPALADSLAEWKDDDRKRTDAGCPVDEAVDRGVVVEVQASTGNPEGPTVAQTFQLYADAINTGRYEVAWSMLTPTAQGRQKSYDRFADALTSSYWLKLDVTDLEQVDAVTDRATVAFRSVQAAEQGPDGQTCSDWTLRYQLSLDSGSWKIDRATPVGGGPKACDAPLPTP